MSTSFSLDSLRNRKLEFFGQGDRTTHFRHNHPRSQVCHKEAIYGEYSRSRLLVLLNRRRFRVLFGYNPLIVATYSVVLFK